MHKEANRLFRKTSKTILVGLLALMVMSLDAHPGRAQQRKVPQDPVQFIDSSTGRLVPVLLVIPRHSSFKGISTMIGEGPERGSHTDYLAKPFVYHTGDPFKIKRPKSKGLPLGPFAFIGKGRSIEGALIFAPGYRPQWFVALWSIGNKRQLQLTPISNNDSSRLLEKELSPLEKGASRINDNCGFWDVPAPCTLEILFDEKERELVRSFLQQARERNK